MTWPRLYHSLIKVLNDFHQLIYSFLLQFTSSNPLPTRRYLSHQQVRGEGHRQYPLLRQFLLCPLSLGQQLAMIYHQLNNWMDLKPSSWDRIQRLYYNAQTLGHTLSIIHMHIIYPGSASNNCSKRGFHFLWDWEIWMSNFLRFGIPNPMFYILCYYF